MLYLAVSIFYLSIAFSLTHLPSLTRTHTHTRSHTLKHWQTEFTVSPISNYHISTKCSKRVNEMGSHHESSEQQKSERMKEEREKEKG